MTISILQPVQENRPIGSLIRYQGNQYNLYQRIQILYHSPNDEQLILEIFWDPIHRQAVFDTGFRDLFTVRTLPGEQMTLRKLLELNRVTMTQVEVDGIRLRSLRGYHLVLDGPLENMESIYQLEIWAYGDHNHINAQG
jgi:hypothetical protein